MDSVGPSSSKAERPEFLIGAHTRMHSLPIRFVFTFSQKVKDQEDFHGLWKYDILWFMIGKEE